MSEFNHIHFENVDHKFLKWHGIDFWEELESYNYAKYHTKKFALSFHANAWVVHGLDNNDDVSGKLPVIKSFFCGFLFLDSIWTIPWSVSLFFSWSILWGCIKNLWNETLLCDRKCHSSLIFICFQRLKLFVI